MVLEDKYIGSASAVTSTLAIGTSFVITKKGLLDAQERHGFEGEGFTYLKSPIWWGGIITMVIGEVANFAAYAFAPAILVTPLGASSVLIGAVSGSYFSGENLGTLGKSGCAICLIGSVVIVLHAPPDKDVKTIDEISNYAIQPGFLFYVLFVGVFAAIMIYRVAPRYGRKNPLIYLSICSTVGSVSIMAIKGFGIALKLTLGGNNQFSHPSTYVFAIVTIVCILTQMNYFNKASSQFSTNIVNPLYYVTFTTFTLLASFILFRGFNTTDPINTISLLCGFSIIFTGVYSLNSSREDPEGRSHMSLADADGIPTDAMAAPLTRRSMQARRSFDSHHSRQGSSNMHNFAHGRRSSEASRDGKAKAGAGGKFAADREGLMHSYDLEQGGQGQVHAHAHDEFGLADLAEDSEEEVSSGGSGNKRTSFGEGRAKAFRA